MRDILRGGRRARPELLVQLGEHNREVGELLGAVKRELARSGARDRAGANEPVVQDAFSSRAERAVRTHRRADPEPASEHDPVAGREEHVDHPGVLHVKALVACHPARDARHPRVIQRVGAQSHRHRREEADPCVHERVAELLDGAMHGTPVRPGLRRGGRLPGVRAMRERVPCAVALVGARVPVEPPVDHLPGDMRHGGAHRDVADPVGQRAPSVLRVERSWVEEPLGLLRCKREGWVHRPALERG